MFPEVDFFFFFNLHRWPKFSTLPCIHATCHLAKWYWNSSHEDVKSFSPPWIWATRLTCFDLLFPCGRRNTGPVLSLSLQRSCLFPLILLFAATMCASPVWSAGLLETRGPCHPSWQPPTVRHRSENMQSTWELTAQAQVGLPKISPAELTGRTTHQPTDLQEVRDDWFKQLSLSVANLCTSLLLTIKQSWKC